MTPNRHPSTPPRRAAWLLLAAAVLALPGCAKWNLGDSFTLFESKPKPQTPETVLAVWTDTTLHQPGKPAVRGFGGRVMFFGEDSGEKSVPVEGRVIVYAFDDERPDPSQTAPEKKFVFPADNLAIHESESHLGPSYNFWLPWDNVGGPQRRLSLLTRFEDKSGKIVMSKTAHVLLPGMLAAPQDQPGILPASHPMPPSAGSPGGLGLMQAAPAAVTGNGGYGGSPVSPNASLGPPEPVQQDVQQVSYQGLATDPYQLAKPGNSAASRSAVTIDVAPGQAQRLLGGQKERGDLRFGAVAGSGSGDPRQAGVAGSGDPRQTQTTPWGPLIVSQQTRSPVSAASRSEPAASAEASARRQAAPPTSSALDQSPARTSTSTRPASDPVRRQPHRGQWLRSLPPTPRSGWTNPQAEPSPVGQSIEN